MTTTELTLACTGAVVVFWIVGAYNRMVRMRSAIVSRFGAVDEHHRQRHALIENQLEMLSTALAVAGPRVEALRAACRQAAAAREHACAHPGAAGAVTSLRVAEEILVDARSRLPVQAAAGVDLPEINSRLAASDTALAFARREFNDAVAAYNQAVGEFPTALVAWLFSFRAAALF